MFFELTDKDLERVKYCSGVVEGYRRYITCHEGGDQHYHFDLKSKSDSRQEIGPKTRINLSLSLLICANLIKEIRRFPLFGHLSSEACISFQRQRDSFERGQYYYSLNSHLYSIFERACGELHPDVERKKLMAEFDEFFNWITEFHTQSYSTIKATQYSRSESIIGFYRVLVLGGWYASFGVDDQQFQEKALFMLKEAVEIAEKINLPANHNLIINLANFIKGFPAREYYYRVMLLRLRLASAQDESEAFDKCFNDFLESLTADEKSSPDSSETIKNYRQQAIDYQTRFFAEKVSGFLNLDIFEATYFHYAKGMDQIIANKRALTVDQGQRLATRLKEISGVVPDHFVRMWCNVYWFRLSRDPQAALNLALMALNGTYQGCYGNTDFERAGYWYQEAIQAAAGNLNFNKVLSIILDACDPKIKLDLNSMAKYVIDKAIEALKSDRPKVFKEEMLQQLLNIQLLQKLGSDRLVELFDAYPVSDFWYERLLKLAMSDLPKPGIHVALNRLMQTVVAHYRSATGFVAEERSHSLLMMVANYNEYCHVHPVGDTHDAFVETLKKSLPDHIAFCYDNNFKALETMHNLYQDKRLSNSNKPIPNYSKEIAYWVKLIKSYLTPDNGYEPYSDEHADKAIEACCIVSGLPRPRGLFKSYRQLLAKIKHPEAYQWHVRAGIDETKKMLAKPEFYRKEISENSYHHIEIKKRLIFLGENLVRLVASKDPEGDLGFYRKLGVKLIESLDEIIRGFEKLRTRQGTTGQDQELDYITILKFYHNFAVGVINPKEFIISRMELAVFTDKQTRWTIDESGLNILQDHAKEIAYEVKAQFLQRFTGSYRIANTRSDLERENLIFDKAKIAHKNNELEKPDELISATEERSITPSAPVSSTVPAAAQPALVSIAAGSKSDEVDDVEVAVTKPRVNPIPGAAPIPLPSAEANLREQLALLQAQLAQAEQREKYVREQCMQLMGAADTSKSINAKLEKEVAEKNTALENQTLELASVRGENSCLELEKTTRDIKIAEQAKELAQFRVREARLTALNHGLAAKLMKAEATIARLQATPKQLAELDAIKAPTAPMPKTPIPEP